MVADEGSATTAASGFAVFIWLCQQMSFSWLHEHSICIHSKEASAALQAFKGLVPRLVDELVLIAEQAAQAAADAGRDHPDAATAGGHEDDHVTAEERQEHRRAEAAAAAESARRLCLAQMEGFSRLHRSEVVQLSLTEQLLNHVDNLLLEDQTRAAILGPLHLL